jgi:hypothetical protein
MPNEAKELSTVQAPTIPLANANGDQKPSIDLSKKYNIFPYPGDADRMTSYEYYERLFLGNHFAAFNIKIDDEHWNKTYSRLRYVAVNFAGLITKIVADMLFSEPVTVKVPEGDQDFIDALWKENNMDVQCYESALGNSYNGDALFKLRVGPRFNSPKEPSTVIIEDTSPCIYYPELDDFNVRAEPKKQELAWTFEKNNVKYLRKEIHYPGRIENKVYEMKGQDIVAEVSVDTLGIPGLKAVEQTKIDRSMLIHTPNWKTGNRYFGLSDYHDLESLFYAINNRMTSVDNILDKHSDPILMVPPGVLDEKGNVRKKALGVVEMGEGEGGKPEYIVWDASLENAFKEIEKLVEFLYLVGEVSPDVLGLGDGVSDSGRALKFKLMRTIAKVARKKLYYDKALKEIIYRAQLLAKAWNLKVGGKTLQGDPVMPEIEWSDGLPIDNHEALEDEVTAIDAGIRSKKEAIMTLYKVDEEAADKMLADIEEEKPTIEMPTMNMGNKTMKTSSGDMMNADGSDSKTFAKNLSKANSK